MIKFLSKFVCMTVVFKWLILIESSEVSLIDCIERLCVKLMDIVSKSGITYKYPQWKTGLACGLLHGVDMH